MAAKSASTSAATTAPRRVDRWTAVVVWSVVVALLVGWLALMAHKALIDQAEQRCIYGKAEQGKPLGQIGAWRWWPPGYLCKKP